MLTIYHELGNHKDKRSVSPHYYLRNDLSIMIESTKLSAKSNIYWLSYGVPTRHMHNVSYQKTCLFVTLIPVPLLFQQEHIHIRTNISADSLNFQDRLNSNYGI